MSSDQTTSDHHTAEAYVRKKLKTVKVHRLLNVGIKVAMLYFLGLIVFVFVFFERNLGGHTSLLSF